MGFFSSFNCPMFLRHICNMGIDGAVLIFLPGWNTISFLKKYLESHPRFQNPRVFQILALHSQVPREDQRLVFRPAPPGARKVCLISQDRSRIRGLNLWNSVYPSCLPDCPLYQHLGVFNYNQRCGVCN